VNEVNSLVIKFMTVNQRVAGSSPAAGALMDRAPSVEALFYFTNSDTSCRIVLKEVPVAPGELAR